MSESTLTAVATDPREMLIVQSKVRDLLRRQELRVSEEFYVGLSNEVHRMVARAAARCLANRRRTLDASDV
jgi:hypothetical protein